jgi:uncharacterized protein (TIGR03435 family)
MPSGRAGFSMAYAILALLALHQGCSRVNAQVATTHPVYEVASVSVTNTNAPILLGFYLYPSGRVTWGGQTVKDLLSYAFDVPPEQVKCGPSWINEKRFDIHALTPLPYRQQQSDVIVNPNEVQRLMLQNLLKERFSVRVHHDSRTRPVLILKLRRQSHNLYPAAHPDGDPHGAITRRIDGTVTGQAFGHNVTMAFWAEELSECLEYPVIDETGLRGGYDFNLPEVDSDNRDMQHAVDLVLDRLGLTLQKGSRPLDAVCVESVAMPTPD